MKETTIRDVQNRILEIMKYIDYLCRKHDIQYFIMGGTALGAVRHQGFIPWDDDLDIFMTFEEYSKFKEVFQEEQNEKFVIQEWRTSSKYLEYTKVRMNNTTFIESVFRDRTGMHHGIYVDIMILHKVPENRLIQKLVYYESKFVTAVGLSERNWIPKTRIQTILIQLIKRLPREWLSTICYRRIYRYDSLKNNFKWCYWITKANFQQGLFDRKYFDKAVDIVFEDIVLKGSVNIKEYLKLRYGDYMKLPSKEEQRNVVHAETYDAFRDYKEYFEDLI